MHSKVICLCEEGYNFSTPTSIKWLLPYDVNEKGYHPGWHWGGGWLWGYFPIINDIGLVAKRVD